MPYAGITKHEIFVLRNIKRQMSMILHDKSRYTNGTSHFHNEIFEK